MNTDKVIRQALKLLGINTSDLDVNNNHYYKVTSEELEDMRTQILDDFEFQIKIANNLAVLPEVDYEPLYVDGIKLIAHALPTDFLSFRNSDTEDNQYIRIKGSIVYMPYQSNYLEYYSHSTPYEHFPVYTERYVIFCLAQRVAVFLGRDSTQFFQFAELEKQNIRDKEKRNTGFSYNGNSLVRR